MREFEIEKEDGYSIVPASIGRNMNLSLSAKGLMYVFFTLPPEWDYSFKGLVSICKEQKHALRTTINELKDAGFIEISQYRDEKGYFRYKYKVFRKSQNERYLNEFYPTPDYRTSDYRNSENQHQLNIKELNDKIDKTQNEKMEHNIFTKELVIEKYLNEEDNNILFAFDSLFEQELIKGHNAKELFSAIHYIVPRVIERDFKDEDGRKIVNLYGYFKNALESNFEKLNNIGEELTFDEDSSFIMDKKKDREER